MSAPTIPGFAEVRLNNRIHRFIRVTKETPDLIVGERVTREGERWELSSGENLRVEVIACKPNEVVRRMALNTHYGQLEPSS